MLQGGRTYTAGELAREMEVSRRTIFRDLNMLELAGIPYYHDPDSGGYKISQHFFLPPINFTLTEALAMLMLTGRLRGADRLPLFSQTTRAAMKLESVLSPVIRQHIGGVLDQVSVSLGALAGHKGLDETFDRLTSAIVGRRICRMVYLSFHEQKQIATFIHPLRLVFLTRAWYLLAYSAMHRQVRTFKLGRMRKLTVTDKTFSWPKDVDLDKHFASAWSMIPEGKSYDVHLRFAPKVAGNVAEVQWHPAQRVRWNDDGSIDYRVRVNGLGELSWWVLGYGDQVEVLKPRPLRDRVAGVAAAVLKKYRGEGT
jgi:proteasome accessory factor B